MDAGARTSDPIPENEGSEQQKLHNLSLMRLSKSCDPDGRTYPMPIKSNGVSNEQAMTGLYLQSPRFTDLVITSFV